MESRRCAAAWLLVPLCWMTAVPGTQAATRAVVTDGPSFAQAMNDSSVASIFVQQSIDLSSTLDAAALNATDARFIVDRDVSISGQRGAAVDFGWSAEVFRVTAGHIITIDGGLVLQRVTRPTLSSMYYNCFLGAFVFETGATLRLLNSAVEHLPTEDPELSGLAGSSQAASELPSLNSSAWTDGDLRTHELFMSANMLRVINSSVSPAVKPSIGLDANGDLSIRSWAVDEQTWDLGVFGRTNANKLFGAYELLNVTLLPPGDRADECTATGVQVFDSASFKAALDDATTYRVKIMRDFAMDPADWGPQGVYHVGVIVLRRIRIIGCVSANDYTVIDLRTMDSVIYVYGFGSLQFRRLRFINVYQAPRVDYLTPIIGIVSIWYNATVSFEACDFVPSTPSVLGPLLYHNISPSTLVITSFLPNFSYAITLVDPATAQSSLLLGRWELVVGPLLTATTGNLTAASVDGSWNWVRCVVAAGTRFTRSTPSADDSGRELALKIALPLAGAVAIALCVLAAFLWRRRRRQRAASHRGLAEPALSASSHKAQAQGDSSTTSRGTHGPRRSGPPNPRADKALQLPALAIDATADAALSKLGRQPFSQNAWDQIKLGPCVGVGGFSSVYKGYWRGSVAAVKVTNLSERLSMVDKLRRMAAMEAAISSSLSHPNIIATYTYAVRRHWSPPAGDGPVSANLPLQRASHSNELPSATSGSTGHSPRAQSDGLGERAGDMEELLAASCEVRLVQEFAPYGNLGTGLKQGRLCVGGDPQGPLDFAAVLDTAMDICKALVHLHNENIVHCDLKPSNVLLVPSSSSPKGFVAKVTDFGLSQSVPSAATHISNVWSGTITHMAPELLLLGQVTFASDIYAFGIIMWELIARQPVRLDCPPSMAPFMVSAKGMRPVMPAHAPAPFAALIRDCWAGDLSLRPTATQAFAALAHLSTQLATGALGPCELGPLPPEAPANGAAAPNSELTPDRVAAGLLSADAGSPAAAAAATKHLIEDMREACSSLGLARRENGSRRGSDRSAPSPTAGSNAASLSSSAQRDSSARLQSTQNHVDDAPLRASASLHHSDDDGAPVEPLSFKHNLSVNAPRHAPL